MAIADSFNFRRVSDLVSTSGVVGEDNLRCLGREGYEIVIDLLPHDSQYAEKNEPAIVAAEGADYVYIPVDFSAPTPSDFAAFATALDRAGDKKVHVHCAANYRVSVFYALYAVQRGIWNQQQADAFITSIWVPAEHPGWLEVIEAVENHGE